MRSTWSPRRKAAAIAGSAVAAATLTGCGSTGLTSASLESAIGSTFANLYVLQQVEQGNPKPSVASLHSHASCQKGTQASVQSGPGSDWLCQITFLVDGPATPVTARYNVTLKTDGCYSADGDGPASVNGSRTIVSSGSTTRVNPLRLIDGCFEGS